MGKPVDADDVARIQQYETDAAEGDIAGAREELQVSIDSTKNTLFSLGVGLLSIAITLRGIANLKVLWYVGIAMGSVGTAIVGLGNLSLHLATR